MIPVPVLTFHALAETSHVTAFPRGGFERMVERWAASGRHPIGIDAFLRRLNGEQPGRNGDWMATFDDGYASFVAAHEACRRAGGRAVLFLSTGLIGRAPIFPADDRCPHQPALDAATVSTLARDGCDVLSHGDTHVDWRGLSDAEIDIELRRSSEIIADLTGTPPRAFAYPFGLSDDRVRGRVAAFHEAAFGTRLAFVRSSDDRHELPRVDAHYLRSLTNGGSLDDPAVLRRLRWRGWMRGIRETLFPTRAP